MSCAWAAEAWAGIPVSVIGNKRGAYLVVGKITWESTQPPSTFSERS